MWQVILNHPQLSTKILYINNGKKEIAKWQAFTDLSAEKQGPAIFLTLSGKTRDFVGIKCVKIDKDGVKNAISKLDTLYLEDTN